MIFIIFSAYTASSNRLFVAELFIILFLFDLFVDLLFRIELIKELYADKFSILFSIFDKYLIEYHFNLIYYNIQYGL